jgi:hypothetical protein
MATLVKFLKNTDSEGYTDLFAYFPNLNANERLYGSSQKQCYAEVDKHTTCSVDYAQESELASYDEYKDLLNELVNQGYDDLKVLNEAHVNKHYENSYNEVYAKLNKENPDFDVFTEKLDKWVATNAPKF